MRSFAVTGCPVSRALWSRATFETVFKEHHKVPPRTLCHHHQQCLILRENIQSVSATYPITNEIMPGIDVTTTVGLSFHYNVQELLLIINIHSTLSLSAPKYLPRR